VGDDKSDYAEVFKALLWCKTLGKRHHVRNRGV
jgi:hypothetical protein